MATRSRHQKTDYGLSIVSGFHHRAALRAGLLAELRASTGGAGGRNDLPFFDLRQPNVP